MGRIIYEKYKGKGIIYDESANTWAVEGFDEEELPGLKAARAYVDKMLKDTFTRFRALADDKVGEITSITADGRKAWFTPDVAKGMLRAYGAHRRQVELKHVYPMAQNVELIAEHERLEAKCEELDKEKSATCDLMYKNKDKMKSYCTLHPEMFVV
jgi:hypothetical protein